MARERVTEIKRRIKHALGDRLFLGNTHRFIRRRINSYQRLEETESSGSGRYDALPNPAGLIHSIADIPAFARAREEI